jgi:hypothetical protein
MDTADSRDIMALGAAYMQTLRAQEEQTQTALVDFRSNLILPLKAELGPDMQIVPKETQKTWQYFTMILGHCEEMNMEAHAWELVYNLHRQIKAVNPKYKVDKVALDVQSHPFCWPMDKRPIIHACLLF